MGIKAKKLGKSRKVRCWIGIMELGFLLCQMTLTGMAQEQEKVRDADTIVLCGNVTEGEVSEEISEDEMVSVSDLNLANGEELFEDYLNRLMYETSDRQRYYVNRRSNLTGNSVYIYDSLKKQCALTADGKNGSTVFEIPLDEFMEKTSYTSEELGTPVLVDGKISSVAKERLIAKVDYDASAIISALLTDLPYDLYWFDKTVGYKYGVKGSYNALGDTLAFSEDAAVKFVFYVSADYSLSGGTNTSNVNTNKTSAAQTAVNLAKSIVAEAAGKTDYERALYYCERICELVSYNYQAAQNSQVPYGDPWQLIHVFDADNTTNVVCEGYSKAYKYLFDLTEFSDPDVECFLVTGGLQGSGFSGPHMWNLVKMDDGNLYLADITNYDSAGGNYVDALFLAGSEQASAAGCVIEIYENNEFQYIYDTNTTQQYTDDELIIFSDSYVNTNGIQQTDDEEENHNVGQNNDTEQNIQSDNGGNEEQNIQSDNGGDTDQNSQSDGEGNENNNNGQNDGNPYSLVTMFRMYNPNSGEHFYTASEEERQNLVNVGWNYEGYAWNAPDYSDMPIYRLYNPNAGDHHYTGSEEEREQLMNLGWDYEGIAWYSADTSGTVIYRLYNPNALAGSHHYTGSEEERDDLVNLGWNYEGVAWFGVL